MTSPNGFWPDMAGEVAPGTAGIPARPTTTDPNQGLPGEPYWWLRKLINTLLDRQPVLNLRERYTSGDHDLPNGDHRYFQALRTIQRKSRTNYCGLITSAPVERMRIRGFRFGPYGQADEDAKRIWMANDMDYQSLLIHQRAATYGVAYALITPAELGSKYPTITAEDPRQCVIYRDPVRPTRALAGLRLWQDEVSGLIMALLYTPDAIYGFEGPSVSDIQGKSLQEVKRYLNSLPSGPTGFLLTDEMPNELGIVPLVEYVWRPNTGIYPEGEAGEDIREVQDRINTTVLERMVITRSQAYKQRWVSGLRIQKNKKGMPRAPFEPGSDILWVTENENAKFGQFDETDITPILEAVRDDIIDIASMSKTPPHYLMGKMANVSGETLTQAESGFVSKTKQRMATMAWSHELVMKICFLYMGDSAKANEVEAQTLWDNPEMIDLESAGDFLSKGAAAGLALELMMDRLNFTPDEIQFAVQERDRLQQQELEQQTQLAVKTAQAQGQAFQQRNAQQNAGGGAGKKPAGKSKPKSASKPTPSK